jgi:hypothetical protein
MHGPGVKIPKAAAVKAAVAGFARLMQTPNGAIFRNGIVSMHVPTGPAEPITIGVGRNVKTPGATPIGHMVIALQQTPNPSYLPSLTNFQTGF